MKTLQNVLMMLGMILNQLSPVVIGVLICILITDQLTTFLKTLFTSLCLSDRFPKGVQYSEKSL